MPYSMYRALIYQILTPSKTQFTTVTPINNTLIMPYSMYRALIYQIFTPSKTQFTTVTPINVTLIMPYSMYRALIHQIFTPSKTQFTTVTPINDHSNNALLNVSSTHTPNLYTIKNTIHHCYSNKFHSNNALLNVSSTHTLKSLHHQKHNSPLLLQ